MAVYTFLRRIDTNEIHIFEGEWLSTPNRCSIPQWSICEGMSRSDGRKLDYYTLADGLQIHCTCNEEDTARLNAAKIGREVCGSCVSHLYETY